MRFGTFRYNQRRPWASEKQAFDELLDQIELTERLNFNEAWFAEHHHSDYGMLASPNLMIAALARRTERLRFGNLVNVLPLYDPMRLAEECAMLDILTGGRLNIGLGRGVPKDDMKHRLDRETARRALRKASKSSCAPGQAKHSATRAKHRGSQEISCRPQPLQKPHPPIYYGASSPDSPAMVARRGWNLALSRQPLANCAKAIEKYRAELADIGHVNGAGDAIMVRDIYVADTDEQAWREAVPEIMRFWQLATDNYWRGETVAETDLTRFTERYAYYPGGLTIKRLDEWGTSLIGSPDIVVKKPAP